MNRNLAIFFITTLFVISMIVLVEHPAIVQGVDHTSINKSLSSDLMLIQYDVLSGDTQGLIAAINDANLQGNGVINLNGGTYTLAAVEYGLTGLPAITGSITINGNNATLSRVTTAPHFRIFLIQSSGVLTLNQVNITGGNILETEAIGSGYSWGGGGILNLGTVHLNNSSVINNYVDSGHPAVAGGAAISSIGPLYIEGSNISDNKWGGLDASGPTFINNSIFSNNRSAWGGAISSSSELTITNSTFSQNSSMNTGGAIFNVATLSVSGSTFNNNSGYWFGGAIDNEGTANIDTSQFLNNFSTYAGGATSGHGGAISNNKSLTVTNSIIKNNSASIRGDGGAIYNWDGNVILTCNTILGNTNTSVVNLGSAPLMKAENNWWGAASGPSGTGSGSGDSVSINVDFTPFLTTEPGLDCPPAPPASLSISNVKFEHQQLPERTWVEPLIYGTTDGNIVRIGINVSNQGGTSGQFVVQARETVTNKVVGKSLIVTTLAPGKSTSSPIQMYWDTTGYAWNDSGTPNFRREIQIELLTPDQQTKINIKRQNFIVIRPKPVILVHGIFSTYCTWNEYKGLLKSANANWKGYAVGDGGTTNLGYNVRMDMGLKDKDPNCNEIPLNFGITNSLKQNAKILGDYIEAVRNREDAWYVDLVGHSMGGLVSRQYIQAYMPLVASVGVVDGRLRPVVKHLVMLGTPNGGAECANVVEWGRGYISPLLLIPLQPMNTELTTLFLSIFNGFVRNDPQSARYVPFYLVAGNKKPTCLEKLYDKVLLFPGDGWVEYQSAAQTIPLDTNKIATVDAYHVNDNDAHQVGVTNEQFFKDYVKKWLALGPSSVSTGSALALPFSIAPQAIKPEPQVIFGQQVDVQGGATLNIPITVPAATRFGVTIVTSSSVESALKNPSGSVSASIAANSPESRTPFETLVVENPVTGIWTLKLTNRGTRTETILISAVVIGSTVEFSASFDTPDTQGQVQVSGTLTNNAVPLTGATVTAKFFTSTGTAEDALTLLDDGLNGDGAANDGVYGKLSNPLPPGLHTISVTATGTGFTRSTGGLVEVKSLDISVTNSGEPDLVFPGTNLTYTLVVSNSGPSNATNVVLTDTLPASVAFVSATSTLGDICAQASGVVTCTVGTVFSGINVSITIVVTTSTQGLITNTANLTATETETNIANNSASVDTTVTITPPTTAPVLVSLDTGFVTSQNTPLFSWNETANATGYQIQIDNSSAFDSPEQDQSGNTLTYQATTLVDGTYYWQVRATNSEGNGPWSTNRNFTVDTIAPIAPNLLTPVDQQVTISTKPIFTWSLVPGANHYEVRLDTVNPPITTVYNGSSLTYTPTVELIPGTYYWHVSAVDAAGNLSQVDARTFIIVSPDSSAPARNYYVINTPSLTWSRITGASTYEIQVDDTQTFSSQLDFTATVPSDQLSITTTSLTKGTYYWRVRACPVTGACGSWSLVDSFAVNS